MQWLARARPSQLPPPGEDWNTWLLLAGRGFGKTRAGAEELAWQVLSHDGWRGAVVAPTERDARDTCMEGESGLLSVFPPECVASWNRSQGELILENGSRVRLFSADVPDRLRGPQHHVAWCDELGAWRYPDALDQLRFGLRLGRMPKMIVTTTPKPVALVRDLVAREGQGVVVARGHTFENAANLAPAALEELRQRYENTRLGRQELYAELLNDVPGALWQRGKLDELRVRVAPGLERIVIAVDPAVTSGEASDATGIVAAGLAADGHVYILADATCRLSPSGWARRVVALFESLAADLVIGEVNQGGDMVETILRGISPDLPFRAVRALRGKALRAEPVAMLYEQGRVHHVGIFAELEEEMCRFAPGALGVAGAETSPDRPSPDRMDALVWAVLEVKLNAARPRVRGI